MTTPAGQQWTREMPTERGYYWFKDKAERPIILCLDWDTFDSSQLIVLNRLQGYKLSQWIGQWQGPILPNDSPLTPHEATE